MNCIPLILALLAADPLGPGDHLHGWKWTARTDLAGSTFHLNTVLMFRCPWCSRSMVLA